MIYEKTENFYNQKLYITNIRDGRFDFISTLCRGKKVLHIGAADAMAFKPECNLHITLCKVKDVPLEEEKTAKAIAKKALTKRDKARGKVKLGKDALIELEPGSIAQLEEAEKEWAEANIAEIEIKNRKLTQIDAMDIDEPALEVLKNHCPGIYFSSYDQIKDEYDLVIVPEVLEHVPNAKEFLDSIFSVKSSEYLFTVPSIFYSQIFCDDLYTLEMVHPDHKYWFSPYTLYNTIKPYMDGYDIQMYYLESKSQVGIRLSAQKTNKEVSEITQ